MSTFEMMLGENLKGSEKFTSLSPEDKEVASKSLEIRLLRKECGHESNLPQLQGAMLEFGIHHTAEEMAALYRRVDTNGDGIIDMAELEAWDEENGAPGSGSAQRADET